MGLGLIGLCFVEATVTNVEGQLDSIKQMHSDDA